ncbi:MAG: FAD-dependent oxidoreductase, partial [Bacilli bacterium]
MHIDIAILGAGITGSAIAFELSKYNKNVVVLEEENDVSLKTTKANSGIVHAGYDPKPGTKMARLNVEGSLLIHELYPLLNFHYEQIGSLVIGSSEKDHQIINDLYERGVQNQVRD